MIELLIGVLVAVGVGRYIIQGYSATGVLMTGGILLLIITALMGKSILPESVKATGWRVTDILVYMKFLFL